MEEIEKKKIFGPIFRDGKELVKGIDWDCDDYNVWFLPKEISPETKIIQKYLDRTILRLEEIRDSPEPFKIRIQLGLFIDKLKEVRGVDEEKDV